MSLSNLKNGWLCAVMVFCIMVPAVRGQDIFDGPTEFIPLDVDRMYVKGMIWLVKNQKADGSFGAGNADHYGTQPGVVGLAVVALLAHGDDPNFGPFALPIKKGLDFILSQQNQSTGYIGSSMYNHGFATLALAEAYGMVKDKRLGPALQKATMLILNSQERNTSGAWRYSPESSDADTTVSGANLVALFAARNSGIPVPEPSIEKALRFFSTCQSGDGGFGYTSAGGSNGPRSAIGCLMFALAKKKDSPRYKSALEYMTGKQGGGDDSHYFHYYLYYAAQAFFHASPKLWNEWNAINITNLKEGQKPDGSWESNFGTTFATAASMLSLALNYRYLPIYER